MVSLSKYDLRFVFHYSRILCVRVRESVCVWVGVCCVCVCLCVRRESVCVMSECVCLCVRGGVCVSV